MKDVFIKFFDTQNIGTILAEITAFFLAWQGWAKYRNEKKKKDEGKFLTSLYGTANINGLLLELEKEFGDRVIIPAILEITNDGGIPKYETPLYLKVLNSNNNELLDLWGVKSLIVPDMVEALIRLHSNSTSHLDMRDFHLKKVDLWSGAKAIKRVHYFMIGTKSKAAYVLAVNIEDAIELTDKELLTAFTYAAKIKEEFNLHKRFWNEKIN